MSYYEIAVIIFPFLVVLDLLLHYIINRSDKRIQKLNKGIQIEIEKAVEKIKKDTDRFNEIKDEIFNEFTK